MDWKEKKWRIPKRHDVVKDPDGNLGVVTRSQGSLKKRQLWVSNVNGTEIYTEEDAEFFIHADPATSRNFHTERLKLKGFYIGSLCSFRNNENIPLEIVQLDWQPLRCIPFFWLKDLREFNGEMMKTDDESNLKPFDLNLPSTDVIFSPQDSGLKWRLEVNLVEVERPGWASSGSPWEFTEYNDAVNEVENWKSRLKVRRVSSVINGDWKITFPCWAIDIIEKENELLHRVKSVESFCGQPGYFKTALHASVAFKLLPIEVWKSALISSADPLF